MDYKQQLTSTEFQTRLKTALRIGGIIVASIGLLFFPTRNFVFNRGDTSAFASIADLGAFIPWGAACVLPYSRPSVGVIKGADTYRAAQSATCGSRTDALPVSTRGSTAS